MHNIIIYIIYIHIHILHLSIPKQPLFDDIFLWKLPLTLKVALFMTGIPPN